ncbi:MAG: hypothetical protein LZF62_60066 [Nitrospira sp.]|nr:MAG: hypothetical protein LZF62_60066 [Nitrospira sp.]
MCVREREIEEDDIESVSAQSSESISQYGGMGNLETVQRPFGKEVLRELGVDGIVFYQEQFDHEAALRLQSQPHFMA